VTEQAHRREPARGIRIGPALLALVLTGLGLWLFAMTATVWLLLFVAILMALYLGALRDYLARRLGINSTAAFWLGITVSIAALAGLVWLIVPPVVKQTGDIINALPRHLQAWDAWVNRTIAELPGVGGTDEAAKLGEHPLLEQLYQYASQGLPGFFGNVSKRALSVVAAVLSLITVGVMAIYIALYPAEYREWLVVLFPPVHRQLVRSVLLALGDTLRAYIVTLLATMFILGGLTALGLWILGVPYWLTFGVLAALCALVPYFGVIVATVAPALFVLGEPGGLTRAILVVALGNAIHVVWGNFISPLMMERSVELPPALTIVAVLLAAQLFGPLGILVAVPLLAVVMVLVRRVLIDRVYGGQGFDPDQSEEHGVQESAIHAGELTAPGHR
jgi:predicted PurR-regulated permease PerM